MQSLGLEQLEARALLSAMPTWMPVAPLAASATSASVSKATPKIEVVDRGGTYNGSAFPATVTVKGVEGLAAASLEGVTPTVTYCHGSSCSSTAPTNAGTYTVVAKFPGSADYVAVQSKPLTFTIAKATPTVHVIDAGGTYNGSAFPATVTLTGIGGLAAASVEGVTPTVTYCHGSSCSSTAPTMAGTYTVVAKFPGSADYVVVQSKPLTLTITPGILQVTSANFQREVMQSTVPVLVDFSADWCEWCQKQLPILEKIAQERPKIKVVEINVDNNPALAAQFNVDYIPRLMVFRNGQKVADAVGLQTEAQLLAMLG